MTVVEEVKRLQAMAASGKAAIDEAWLALDKLVGDGRLTESEQREIVWDSFSDMHPELRKQCPYFDPQHDVWTKQESAESEKAMAELSRIMSDTNALQSSKRAYFVSECARWTCMLTNFGAVLIAQTGASASLKKAVNCVMLTVGLLSSPVWLFWFVKSIKLSKYVANLPKDAYIPVRYLSDPQAQQLSYVELEYSKSWAAAHNWRLRRQDGCSSDFAMWRELDKLVGGYITRFGRAQIFWDSHSPDEQSILSRECQFFDIDHEVWSSNSLKEIRHADIELEIAVLSGHVWLEKRLRGFYLMGGALALVVAAAVVGLWQPSDAFERKVYFGVVGFMSLSVLIPLSIVTCMSRISTRRVEPLLRDLVKQRDRWKPIV